MMERKFVADDYEFVWRTKSFFEAIERFRRLHVKTGRIFLSESAPQETFFDQFQRFTHYADEQPYENLRLSPRDLILDRVFACLIRGNYDQFPECINLVRRIA